MEGVSELKHKCEEMKFKEINGILDTETLSVEIDGVANELQELIEDYDGCDISIKLRKDI